MNLHKVQLLGELEARKRKTVQLVLAGKSHIDAIKEKLFRSSFVPLEKINASEVLYHAQELSRIQKEHKQILEEISRVEEELE